MNTPRTLAALSVAGLLLAGVAWAEPSSTQPSAAAAERTTPSGLRITDTPRAEEVVAKEGDIVWVQYTGRLADGTVFDSSSKRPDPQTGEPDPISFKLGAGRVIKGWDEGIAGMRVGDKRTLVIPPDLGYGARGAPGAIPPNATLTFDVELVGVYRGNR